MKRLLALIGMTFVLASCAPGTYFPGEYTPDEGPWAGCTIYEGGLYIDCPYRGPTEREDNPSGSPIPVIEIPDEETDGPLLHPQPIDPIPTPVPDPDPEIDPDDPGNLPPNGTLEPLPGWGYGDPVNEHDGPPGLEDKE